MYMFVIFVFAFLSIPDSLLPNSDSLSLLIQSYIPTCIRVCLCTYIFVLFFPPVYLTAGCLTLCFSSNQAAYFVQQPVVGPASRRFCRAFIAWVSVCVSCGWVLRYCIWVKVLIFYNSLPWIWLCFECCLCLCVCVCLCHGDRVCTGRQTDAVERD